MSQVSGNRSGRNSISMKRRKIPTYVIAVPRERVRKDMLEILRCANAVAQVLRNKNWPVKILSITEEDFVHRNTVAQRLCAHKPRCVINFFEGFSNDPQREVVFAKIMERTGIPFTGNSSFTLGLCLHKQRLRKVLMHHAIPVPRGILLKRKTDIKKLAHLSFPLFVKPCAEDGSVGIDRDSLVANAACLERSIHGKLGKFPGGLVAEEFIDGKEYCVGFFGNKPPYVLVGISCLDYARHPKSLPFLSYNSKWEKNDYDFKELIPSSAGQMPHSIKKKLLTTAYRAAVIAGCRGYFRVDMREKNGTFFVLEVNPNPDINRDSGFVRQAHQNGYTYDEIIETIIRLGMDAPQAKPVVHPCTENASHFLNSF